MTSTLTGLEIDSAGFERNTMLPTSAAYQSLIYTVFQRPREKSSSGVVIALTSVNRGEGVTYVTRQLAHEFSRCNLNSVACVNMSFLRRLHEPTVEALRTSIDRSEPRVIADSETSLRVRERRGPWEANWRYRRECIDLLRTEFEQSIIDCPSLEESGDLLSIAPFVDGVIVVVEANRTRREQPRYAEQLIASANGKVLGYILNKRSYEVPRWLYKWL